jgi:hypothetical protein
MAWSRSDHRAYATILVLAACGWAAVGIVIALTQELSLADYLVKLFLPTAPALLDTIELQSAHRKHAAERELHLLRLDALLRDGRTSQETITADECRQIQDSAYLLRAAAHREFLDGSTGCDDMAYNATPPPRLRPFGMRSKRALSIGGPVITRS